MRISLLLQKIFVKSHARLDKRLHRLILSAGETLCYSKHLSIVGLGRALKRRAGVKHNIKTIDRLFGNKKLGEGATYYYQDCVHWLVSDNKRPIILVDWSGLTRCGAFHFLRASVPIGGRALPILDMAFSLKDYATPKTHKAFIKRLRAILPHECKPIVITDAGFRCPWFQLIRKTGWDFIGRVRNTTQYKRDDEKHWYKVKTLYSLANTMPRYLFKGTLAKSNPVNCFFYFMKHKKKYRVKKNLIGKKVQCSASKKHEKRENEPWLIVTSLSPQDADAQKIMMLYKKRMQIEEGFRDLKNTKNGFSLRHCRSYSAERLNVALLIGGIAIFLLWLLGLVAKNKKIHFSFQANTVKNRNVLSTIMIGWQALMRGLSCFTQKDCMRILYTYRQNSAEDGLVHAP